MRINHNIASLNTYRQLTLNNMLGSKSLEKLSSGLRINRAGDDAAGLAISEKMRGQIRGLDQAVRNAQDGISLIQTAEGALNEVHSILQRMRELAVQAANGTLTSDDREKIQGELDQLIDEIDKIGNQTEFNTKKLLNGNIGVTVTSNNTWADSTQKVAVIALSSTAETQSGSVTVDVTTAPTQSTTGNGGAFTGNFETGASITITNRDGEATTIALAQNDDITAVIEKINAVKDQTGVEAFVNAADGGIKLRSVDYGSNSKFTVSGTGSTLNKAGISNTVTAGSDIAATLGDGSSITVDSRYGNRATIASGALKGVTFEVKGTNEAAKIVGISVAAASADGDKLVVNGYTINLTAGQITTASDLANVVNQFSRNTGVTATVEADGRVTFTSVATGDGVGISLSYKSSGLSLGDGTNELGTGNKDVVTTGGVLDSSLKNASYTAGTDNIDGNTADATLTATAGSVELHVGANQDQTLTLRVGDIRTTNLATGVQNTFGWSKLNDLKGKGVKTEAYAEKAIEFIDAAITKVSEERGNLGAIQNRLEHTINNLGTASENLTAAESRIRDVDMAKEMMEFTKMNILQQAATAMLAQANQQPQMVLQLLGR